MSTTFDLPETAEDRSKLAALQRTKAIATSMLVLCVALFATARLLQDSAPWLSFVAAFFEAAAIGGLADWYAVVALFKRPLGLPIPHTAIIPENQNRIADNLGQFIEVNFLAPEPVRAKLAEVDFASLVAEWLSDPGRAEGLSRFVARLIPKMVSAVEESGLRNFVTARMLEQLHRVDVAPLAADLLAAFTEDNRHQKLFDEIIKVLGRFLKDDETLDVLRERIREELPTLFNLFRADAYLLKRIVGSAGALLEEVRKDRDHPMRGEFDQFVKRFVKRLRTSKDYQKRAERMKTDLLARPELHTLADEMWKSLRAFIEQDAAADASTIRVHMASLFVDIGRQLSADPQIRADMNEGFVMALSSFVESQKSGVSGFISEQVKRWDLAQLTRLIEMNIGRDLQYIRFNGMIVGGLAGLGLHTFERLFLAG